LFFGDHIYRAAFGVGHFAEPFALRVHLLILRHVGNLNFPQESAALTATDDVDENMRDKLGRGDGK
jgi:hypothetical protein